MRVLQRAFIFALMLCVLAGAGAQEKQIVRAEPPIVFPSQSVEYAAYPDSIVNVLIMGIDFGTDGYWGSGYKMDIHECHTDAVMVIAVNLNKKRIDIVSIPRDTVTVVPGVRGVYKLNGAANCADTVEDGLLRTKAAVEWLLGGIRMDCFFAVDMTTMFRLGDAIGGVDFEMDMNYVGSSGTQYTAGWQHLSGTGIMDYFRARTNATVDDNDLGRARRQRDLMTAVFQKLLGSQQGLMHVLDVLADPNAGFFTNLTGTQAVGFLALLPMLAGMDAQRFASYSLDGVYRTAMGFNFTFTDQEHRAEVIKAVYGIDVPPIPYVSQSHAKWLEETGFYSIHSIRAATEFKEKVEAMRLTFTDRQREAWDLFIAAYWNAVDQFQISADTLDGYAVGRMKTSRIEMRTYADELKEAIDYPEDIPWSHVAEYWYDDPYINEYQLDWR
ncbi:MAG: LCP family protein [Bacillota bacterium]